MDQQKKHRRRVSFSDVQQEKPEDYINNRDIMKSESFRRGSSIMNSKESDQFAATIAAAAYAIYSLEETRAEFEKRMVESFREDPNSIKSKSRIHSRDDNSFERSSLGNLMGQSSQVERRNGDDQRSNSMSRISTRAIEITGLEQRGSRRLPNKADEWEQARLAKINNWYVKMSKKIIDWENEKKKNANISMERRKAEIERLKRINLHHYQNKLDKIEDVAVGARKHLEEKKRNEEAYAKQQANKIRSTGRAPVQCLCFDC
ncbi:uncharacterized protein LOC110700815 [Chenopodium quinoa]|uniref:Remorin C-terminal domain-containing protein n=1 Tax=Chenopodium quinoa TaxID=63459 RepID=A0A803L9E8_CHEQI|nr:uncharacterized protein LOC110700815 [Chenopodium quinoa]